MKSFLKWPGGKTWLTSRLAPELAAHLSPDGTYFEPFLGSGAMFFALEPRQAQLSDINNLLINTYIAVREDPLRVVERVWKYKNDRNCYLRVRSSHPTSAIGTAARFIYLNRTAWGGMYRENGKGEFNVPFGASNRRILEKRRLLACSEVLKSASVFVEDFEVSMGNAGSGDVVYADPPYVQGDVRGEAVFNRYNAVPFGIEAEKRLACAAEEARNRGAFVCVSSFWTTRTQSLWSSWWIVQLERQSSVSRQVNARKRIVEILIMSEPPRFALSCDFVRI